MSYRTLEFLYLSNAALLVTHEMDSAYWHEWELLHLPGGIQLFLVLNLALVLLVLVGLRLLVLRRRSGLWCSFGLAGAGVLAFVIHTIFLLDGHPAFRLPVSMGVLGLSLVLSVLQGAVTWRHLARADPSKPDAAA
jgi:membrane-bound ClpP family serine protease